MFNSNLLWAIGGFLVILTPIVILHEFGHFWAAKLSKIRVEEFGFGLPPRAVKLFERGGTVYSLNWIPVGGFVRPAGEDDPNVPGGLASAPSERGYLFWLPAQDELHHGHPVLLAGARPGCADGSGWRDQPRIAG